METTRITVNPPEQQEGTPYPLLLNPQDQSGTEESVQQLRSKKVLYFTMGSQVYTMEASLKNSGRQLKVIEDIPKQLVGSGMASTPSTRISLDGPY